MRVEGEHKAEADKEKGSSQGNAFEKLRAPKTGNALLDWAGQRLLTLTGTTLVERRGEGRLGGGGGQSRGEEAPTTSRGDGQVSAGRRRHLGK